MKANVITLMLLAAICLGAYAQDDDMYSFSSKKKTQKSTQQTVTARTQTSLDYDEEADYHTGQLRDVDEYNRRGPAYSEPATEGTASYRLSGDTLYVSSEPSIGYDAGYSDGYQDGFYDGDFTYTSRLARYRGYRMDDPFYWDYYYSWYDPWYSWHSPFYYNYIGWNGWGISWGWYRPYYYSSWDYGWYHPHYYGGYYHHGGYSRPAATWDSAQPRSPAGRAAEASVEAALVRRAQKQRQQGRAVQREAEAHAR